MGSVFSVSTVFSMRFVHCFFSFVCGIVLKDLAECLCRWLCGGFGGLSSYV